MQKRRSYFERSFELLSKIMQRYFDVLYKRKRLAIALFMTVGVLFFAGGIYGLFDETTHESMIPLFLTSILMLVYGFSFYGFGKLRKRREDAISELKYSEVGDLEHKEHLLKIKDEHEFKKNLRETIILKSFKIEGLDFFSDFIWEFNPGINVLLGKNGYGKSYLLRLFAALLYRDEGKSRSFFEGCQPESIVSISLSRSEEWRQINRNSKYFFESIGKVPILAIPDMRYVNQSKTTIDIADTDSLTEDDSGDLRSNGATHFIYQQPYEALIQTFLYQLCIDYLDHSKSFDRQIFRLIKSVVEELTKGKFSFEKIKPAGSAKFEMKVLTEADDNRPIAIQKASQGTLSVLVIFGLIHNYLRSVFPDVNDKELLNQHGIVIIDEIDAHLHPMWQQKILSLLRRKFQNIQFIVTAHSPLVVAGCLDGEVCMLQKKQNGFGVYQFQNNFVGWEPDEILRKVFDVEEKDEAFYHYNSLHPKTEEISKQITRLENMTDLTEKERGKLVRLRDDLYYSGIARNKQKDRLTYNQIERERDMLKGELENMKEKYERIDPTTTNTEDIKNPIRPNTPKKGSKRAQKKRNNESG